ERIHRSNLVGMGVIPLVFEEGTSWQMLGLRGDEQVTIRGLHGDLKPHQRLQAEIVAADGGLKRVPLICRIDTADELDYFRNGGILQYVLRRLAAQRRGFRAKRGRRSRLVLYFAADLRPQSHRPVGAIWLTVK